MSVRRRRTMPRSRPFLATLVAALAASCSDDGDAGVDPALTLTITPAVVRAAVGDTVLARVTSPLRLDAATRFHWVGGGPALAPVDTVVGLGAPVALRAVAPGSAFLTIEVTSPGYPPAIVTLPAEIGARP